MNNSTPSHPAQTDSLLFEHFATLATAPDGIARLRKLILQLAVRGKLGTQDERDEPASVLLERIRKEKERLVKENKIKKEKPLKATDYENSYEILPKSWVWTRLSQLGLVNPRNSNIADDEAVSFIPMTLIPVGYKKSAQHEITKWGEIKAGFTHFADNDVVMAKITPCFQNGKSVVLKNLKNGIGAGTTELHVFRSIKNLTNPEYILLFLKTPEFLETGIRRMTGSAGQKRVPSEYFSETPFPLPPLTEQHRIVAKVDRLMAICDELEARQQQEQAGCLKLGTVSLFGLQNATHPEEFGRLWAQVCDAFDLILDCPENVAVLRQTILQLAVQGLLVRREPGDEPAETLVERIRKEKERLVKEGKSKKEKPHEPVHSDEVPFILPNWWMWCRFNDVATIETNIVPPDDFQNLPHVAPDNIEKGTGRLLQYRTVAEDDVQSPNHHFYPNQIVYSKIRPNLSKLTIVDFEGLCSADMYPIYSHIFNKYLKIFMLSLPFYHQAVSDENRLAMPKINQTQLNLIYVAVPPLEEQHRIVVKVEALMALCDRLDARLKERAGVQGKLALAVVKQVAG